MKCPICGHHLSRLADPCLYCAEVLSGGRATKTALTPSRSALTVPTTLTLPAELRVPEATESALPTRPVADKVEPVAVASPSRAHTLPSRSPATGSASPAASSPALGTRSASAASPPAAAARASGRAAASTAIRRWAAVGVALLALGSYLGSRTNSDSARATPSAPSVGASNREAVAPAAANSPDIPVATVREATAASVRPVRTTASAATVSLAATPRLKAQVAKNAAVALPVAPSSPSVAVTADAAPPQSVVVPPRPVAAAPSVADPREACGKRGFIATAVCINEHCAQAEFSGHAECVRLRKAADDVEHALARGG